MIIKYTNYADGIHFIELSRTAVKLGLEEPFHGKVLLKCKMDKSHSQIVLDCDITADIRFTCDRCANGFKGELNNHFQNIYLFSKKEETAEESDLYFLAPDNDKIDLYYDVAEYAKLSIPLKLLCRDDCKGLCPRCGKNLNDTKCNCDTKAEDPRWAPLNKLKDKLNK